MAKKKKKQKPKQGHPARLQAGVVSMDRVKVGRGLDALTGQFVQWAAKYRDDPEMTMMLLATVRETLGIYAEVVGLDKVTDFDPPKLLAVLSSMLEFEEAEDPEAAASGLGTMIFMAWSDYAEFLRDSGLWEREDESLEWFLEALEAHDPFGDEDDFGDNDEIDEIIASDEASQAALAEIAAMPISKLARAALPWVLGEGKKLWDSMPVDEFMEIAAAALADYMPAGVHESRHPVVLGVVLMALESVNAIKLPDKGKPERGLMYEDIMQHEDADAFEANFYFIQACMDLFMDKPESMDEASIQAWGLAAFWIVAGIDGTPHRVDAPRDDQFSPEVWETAHVRLRELVSLGLLEEGETYSVPAIVRLAITDVENDLLDDGDEFDDAELDALFGPEGDEPKRLKREVPYTGKVLQLKLGLKDAKPPIWRRVLVPMDLNLGDLHDIIQASFDWYDGHLHIFYAGGFGGTSYGPEIDDMDYEKNEAETLVSSLLKKEKDRLDYMYDFGDGWEIRIDVEKVLDADDGQLPRCTGGRRMAPLEDSGGVGGWEAKLEILEDPTDPEYEEVKEWLSGFGGDEEDEVDPAYFSKEDINAHLELEF
ncbi:plasmid pRiA4b ORF-3 family protein [Glutamicibacter nicotianae]|uniref:plasmid pRiA4b ORF-3 family protein n=1 Tax=Glutamicibacter nicotianae TaxID=37929 RepID=UPI00167F7EEB|nr:plasmid pRiA4b ORF-3 family protein [Glutamicibacter nicotianae]